VVEDAIRSIDLPAAARRALVCLPLQGVLDQPDPVPKNAQRGHQHPPRNVISIDEGTEDVDAPFLRSPEAVYEAVSTLAADDADRARGTAASVK
jgi:hypothetical protein